MKNLYFKILLTAEKSRQISCCAADIRLILALIFLISLPFALFAQAPAISYSGPQTYTAGFAITSLSPVSSGVGFVGYSSPVTIGTGFSQPTGIATDAAGNVYVADAGTNSVYKIPAGGGPQVTIGTGFNNPGAIAADAAGNVYVADRGNNVVKEILAGSGTATVFASGFNNPVAVAVDAAGNVYVAGFGNSAVYEVPAGGGTPVAIGSGFSGPTGIAVDPNGDIYVSESGSGVVLVIPPARNVVNSATTNFSNPLSVATDNAGNLYVTNGNTVNESAANGVPEVNLSGFNKPFGLTLDEKGNLYVTDTGNGLVKKFSLTGGYFISPGLPPGLSFDYNSGTISGTPRSASPASNYTITAYNSSGSSAAIVSIAVNVLAKPVIAYAGPQTYTKNIPIQALSSSNSGGVVASPGYSSSTPVIIAPGAAPFGVASDAAGNLYVTQNGGTVSKIPVGGGAPVTLGSGFSQPRGIAVDAAGNVYVADGANTSIIKILAGSGTKVPIGSGFNDPTGVAVDASGNVYVADLENNAIKEIPATGGGVILFASTGLNQPYSVAADAAGNVYVADYGNSSVYKIPAGGGAPVALGTGYAGPQGIAADDAGNVYVADTFNGAVKEIPAGSNTAVGIGPGFSDPTGVALDAAGNIYVPDDSGLIKVIKPVGGYYIGPFLPAGLSFNNVTGVISGIPTVAGGSPATNYTVTAYNSTGSGSATINITVNAPSAPPSVPPAIRYNSPQTYTKGTAITALTPVSSSNGVAAPGYGGSLFLFGPGLGNLNPNGVATDASGNVYVTLNNGTVGKIPVGGGALVTVGTGFSQPMGIAADASGNVYVADGANTTITKILAGSGTEVPIGSGFNNPAGVAVDASGNVYVADFGNNELKEIPAAGGSVLILASNGLNQPYGVAADASGNVYVADYGNSGVFKISVAGGAPVALGSGYAGPRGIAVDAAGNVYVADTGNGAVKEIPAGSSAAVSIGPGIGAPTGVTLDAAGNIYVSGAFNQVQELKPVGGYYISPFLPSGLNFNGTTGTISGTPAAVSPATNYTVTAYNSSGSGSSAVNITVNALTKPTISYPSPQTYISGTAIIALTPTNTGGAVAAPAYSSNPVIIGTGYNQNRGVATDAEGNVYVTDFYNNAIKKIPAGGGAQTVFISGLNGPSGIAIDGAGNIYVCISNSSTILEIPGGVGNPGATPKTIGTGFKGAEGVAVDVAGNVYVADYLNNAVKEILASNGSTISLGSSWNYPSSVAVDAAGNVYVTNTYSNTVLEIPANGGPIAPVGSGFSTPQGVSVDAEGNVFVADVGNQAVKMVPAAGGSPISLGSGYITPNAVCTDAAGNVYVGDPSTGTVKQIEPVGGYFLNTALPPGLSFNETTGIVSGKPIAISPAKNYTITAYNIFGGSIATVNITVSFTSSYTAPTIQASKVNFTNTSYTSSTANWTNGNGTSVAVFIAQTAYGSAAPVNGVTYTAGATFGSGTEIGATGWYCVYNGPADNVAVTGLTAGTTYRITAVSYNGTPGSEAYLNPANTSVAVRLSPASMTTLFTTPNEPARKVEFTNTTYTSTTASWTDGNGSARAVFILQGANGGPLPADGTAFTANASSYTAGTEVGTSGWYCVYNGTGSSVDISGLAIGTTYRVSVVEYNTISGVQKYLTTGQSPANITTLMTVPTEPARKVEFSNTTNTSTTASWTNGNGSARAVFIINAPDGGAFPVNGTSYSASPTSGPGTEIGSTGWFCIYNGTGSSVNISGLYSGTIYRVAVVEYNTISGTEYYLTTGQSPANVTTTGPHTLNHVFGGEEPFPLISSLSDQTVEANNILTPNGDGINDTWTVKNITNYPNNRVTVYDRTGNIVYTKQGYANDWAGTYHGSVLNQGTYYYLVDLGNGSTLRGFITVVRDR